MSENAARSFEELHIYQRARELTNAVCLQESDYRGEKFARPQRQAVTKHEQQRAKDRDAKLANMCRRQEPHPSDPPNQ